MELIKDTNLSCFKIRFPIGESEVRETFDCSGEIGMIRIGCNTSFATFACIELNVAGTRLTENELIRGQNSSKTIDTQLGCIQFKKGDALVAFRKTMNVNEITLFVSQTQKPSTAKEKYEKAKILENRILKLKNTVDFFGSAIHMKFLGVGGGNTNILKKDLDADYIINAVHNRIDELEKEFNELLS
jgi:hypothetical protein